MAIAGRTSWKGHLKISLVTIPVALVNAVTHAGKITLNQLHRGCGQRLRQHMQCPEHGEVGADEIVKGYEYEKGRYVAVDDEDLDRLKIETTKVISITQFSPADQIDPSALDTPYWIVPDGKVANAAFAAFRDAMDQTGMVGIGRVVLSGREKAVMLRPVGHGLGMATLHTPRELRKPGAFFEDIPEAAGNEEEALMAQLLVKRLSKPFDLSQFEDRYQEAMEALINAKLAGQAPPVIEEPVFVGVPNLMEALRRSLEAEGLETSRPVPDKAPPATEPRPKRSPKRKATR